MTRFAFGAKCGAALVIQERRQRHSPQAHTGSIQKLAAIEG
jgi:hypothetical protein